MFHTEVLTNFDSVEFEYGLFQNTETLKHSCIFNHPYFIYVAEQPVRRSRK